MGPTIRPDGMSRKAPSKYIINKKNCRKNAIKKCIITEQLYGGYQRLLATTGYEGQNFHS